jgi:hypothetical protein
VTVRPPLTAIVLAVLLGLLAAFAAACGEEDSSLLTSGKADSMKESLDRIDEAVASGRCERAVAALRDLQASIDTLPPGTSGELAQRLEDGAANLRRIAPEDCRDNADETDTDTTTTTTPTTTETVPTTTTPTTTETTPTTTTPTTPTTTTPTTPTTPTVTTPPEGTGGDQAPTTTP